MSLVSINFKIKFQTLLTNERDLNDCIYWENSTIFKSQHALVHLLTLPKPIYTLLPAHSLEDEYLLSGQEELAERLGRN